MQAKKNSEINVTNLHGAIAQYPPFEIKTKPLMDSNNISLLRIFDHQTIY